MSHLSFLLDLLGHVVSLFDRSELVDGSFCCLSVQVGFNKDGYIQALDVTMYANDGYMSENGYVVNI